MDEQDIDKIYAYYNEKMNSKLTHHIDLLIYLYVMYKKNIETENENFELLEKQIIDNYYIYLTIKDILNSDKPITYYEKTCFYKDICKDCNTPTTSQKDVTYYCIDYCDVCKCLRDTEKKFKVNKVRDKFVKQLKLDNKEEIVEKPTVFNNVNININNTTIVNINQPVIKNYIETRDTYFEVFIRNKHKPDIDKLKHIFIFNMCRSKAPQLFPGEDKYNYSITYPIFCATYTIEYENDKPVLHALIRYLNSDSSWINANKLQKITNDKTVLITVNKIKNYNDTKYCIDKEQITNVFNTISSNEYYGSPLIDFYEDTI